jgi:predicted phage terminase large subunit-like protein
MGGPGSGNPRWTKGVSGNPNGRPLKGESVMELLEEYGNKIVPSKIGGREKALTYKRLFVQKLWSMAIKDGDSAISKYIFDRIEGPIKNIIETRDGDKIESETFDFIRQDLIRTKQFVHPWYKPAFFHREISDNLQDEKIKRLIVTMPPQFGKTELLCKTFPAWYLGNNPENSVMVASYNQEYVNKLSVQCRDFFNDQKFMTLFYDLKLHPDQQTKHEWMIGGHQGGAIFAGVGGTLTGNTADVLLIDDVTKDFEDASSKVVQESIWNWYQTVTGTRLKGENSRIIIIMTRWLKNDLIGRILRHEEENNIAVEDRFKVLHYPAILGVEGDDYSKGKSLWPEKKSMKFLLERQAQAPSVFKTMWMGNPRDLEGCIIKPEWIRYEQDVKSLGEKILSCRGWDFGYTESGDETVGARIDVYQNGELYTPILADVVSCRKDPTAVKEFVVATAQADGPDVIIGVESGGTQIAMSSDLMKRRELANFQVRAITPKGDKISRAMPWILKLEDGMFRLAKGPWNKMVVDSMCDFSDTCDHDDIEDAITNAWKTIWGVTQ